MYSITSTETVLDAPDAENKLYCWTSTEHEISVIKYQLVV